MTNAALCAAFADVMQRYGALPLGTDEWTVQQFADAQGISYNQAANIIDRAEKDHALLFVGMRRTVDGHRAKAYRYVSSVLP